MNTKTLFFLGVITLVFNLYKHFIEAENRKKLKQFLLILSSIIWSKPIRWVGFIFCSLGGTVLMAFMACWAFFLEIIKPEHSILNATLIALSLICLSIFWLLLGVELFFDKIIFFKDQELTFKE